MSINILSNLVITGVRSVSTLYSPESKKARRVNRPLWAIILKYEGETVYTSGGKNFLSDISHVAVLPKGCSYDWHCTREGHFCTVEFECDLTHPEPMVFPVKNGEQILKMMKELERKRALGDPMTELICIRDIYSIIILLAGGAKGYLPSAKQKRIAPAIEYVSTHYNERLTNERLAEAAGMSVVYFRKLFKEVTGVSPITYLHRFKIERAKEMLRSDYGALSDIATSLGYPSLYDFSRDFKKHTGVCPSRYGDGRR